METVLKQMVRVLSFSTPRHRYVEMRISQSFDTRLNIKKLNTVASVRINRFRINSSFLSAAPVRLLFHDLSIFDSTFQAITWNCKAFFLSFLSCRQKTEGFPFRKENYNRPTFDSWPRLNHWRARSE